MVKAKTCTACGAEKAMSEYHAMASARDGLAFECRECASARSRAYHESHREARKQRQGIENAHPSLINGGDWRIEEREG